MPETDNTNNNNTSYMKKGNTKSNKKQPYHSLGMCENYLVHGVAQLVFQNATRLFADEFMPLILA